MEIWAFILTATISIVILKMEQVWLFPIKCTDDLCTATTMWIKRKICIYSSFIVIFSWQDTDRTELIKHKHSSGGNIGACPKNMNICGTATLEHKSPWQLHTCGESIEKDGDWIEAKTVNGDLKRKQPGGQKTKTKTAL